MNWLSASLQNNVKEVNNSDYILLGSSLKWKVIFNILVKKSGIKCMSKFRSKKPVNAQDIVKIL